MNSTPTIYHINLNGHKWKVRFVPSSVLGDGVDGFTWTNRKTIDVCNEYDIDTIETILTHELVHALLDTQGRCYQKKFNLEELCELVAWNIDTIYKIKNEVIEKYEKQH